MLHWSAILSIYHCNHQGVYVRSMHGGAPALCKMGGGTMSTWQSDPWIRDGRQVLAPLFINIQTMQMITIGNLNLMQEWPKVGFPRSGKIQSRSCREKTDALITSSVRESARKQSVVLARVQLIANPQIRCFIVVKRP